MKLKRSFLGGLPRGLVERRPAGCCSAPCSLLPPCSLVCWEGCCLACGTSCGIHCACCGTCCCSTCCGTCCGACCCKCCGTCRGTCCIDCCGGWVLRSLRLQQSNDSVFLAGLTTRSGAEPSSRTPTFVYPNIDCLAASVWSQSEIQCSTVSTWSVLHR